MARQVKEASKAKQILEKEQGMTNIVDNDESTTNETRIMSNTLDNIVDNTQSFPDHINIQDPHYQNGGLPTFFIPTIAGVNLMYANHTYPLNPGVSSAIMRYFYLILPWLKGEKWTQSYGSNPPHHNQPFLGRSTYLAQARNLWSFGIVYSQGHKE